MRTIKTASADAFARAGADWIGEHVKAKPNSVLAVPTGSTPLALYAECVLRARAGMLDVGGLRIYNLDEYCGLPASDPHSYAAFIHQQLAGPLNLAADKVRLLRGDAGDLEAECKSYDAEIAADGGIDLCILGLGVNGHIAFNEPGSSWEQRTHIAHLAHATRAAHERLASAPWRIPTWGITMGIKTLLEARHVLLLIAGERKQAARDALFAGVPDPDWPVTSLLSHPSLNVIELCEPGASR